MSQMAIAVRRTHLGADHAVGDVPQFAVIGGLDGFGKARPAAPRLIFVGRGKQRLARYDVDVDAGFLVVQIFACAGALGGSLLRHAILLRRKPGDGLWTLLILLHFPLLAASHQSCLSLKDWRRFPYFKTGRPSSASLRSTTCALSLRWRVISKAVRHPTPRP